MTTELARRLVPIEHTDVTIEDDFWAPLLKTLHEHTIDAVYESLESSGRLENFRIAAGRSDAAYTEPPYNDASVYKWLEAATALLAAKPDPTLAERVEDVIDLIEETQEDDGYLNTYFTVEEPNGKWTNLHWMHELYNNGHLIEAAVTHHQSTGSTTLLDIARDLADHIARTFGPDAKRGYPGHPEIELALIRLYRETGVDRYRETAQYFVNERGQDPSPFVPEIETDNGRANSVYHRVCNDDGEYYRPHLLQDHTPVREQETVEGHAVRAMYLYCSMTDLAAETDDEELLAAVRRLWENMTIKRMYVTGGIGSTHEGERFTEDYDLPNETAYAETCAAIGNVFWNHRLLQVTGDSQFGDVLERTLYNGVLAGISLSGDRFFYANTLEYDGEEHGLRHVNPRRFRGERQEWYSTSCCPTNALRLLASLGRYIYLSGDDELAINLYVGSRVEATLGDNAVTLVQESSLPWDGTVQFRVEPESPTEGTISFRIPKWAQSYTVHVRDDVIDVPVSDGFASITREWERGDVIEITFDLAVTRLAAHPNVDEDFGKVALQRGPLVYCLEGIDNHLPLHEYVVSADSQMTASHEPDLLNGVTVIKGDAAVPDQSTWTDTLYQPVEDTRWTTTKLQAIPYYGWANRERSEMRVWLQSDRSVHKND